MSDRPTWRRRALLAIPVAIVFVLLYAWSRSEREERASHGEVAADRSIASASSAGVRPAPAERDAGAPTSDSIAPIARAPVRLSAPVVRRDPGERAGSLRGRVLSFASGAPIAGAELTFAREGTTRSVRTDGEGAFVFAPEVEGEYVLALGTAEGFLPFAPEWGHSPVRFAARAGVRLEGVVVYLVDAIEYVAHVVDADERPVVGARLRVFGAEHGERALAPIESGGLTDAHGDVRFSAPDGAVIEASHEAHGHGRGRVDAAVQVSRTLTIHLAHEREVGSLRIAGRVLGPRGEPIEALISARHAARPSSAEAELHPPLEATSDADGRFVLAPADEGAYRLVVTAPGHARAVLERVESGSDDVVVRLAAEGRLLVRVRDATSGAPVPAVTVVVTRMLGPIAEEAIAIESAYDAEGELEIGGLPAGACSVLASSPGYALSAPGRATIGEARAEVRIELDRGGTITGQVASEESGAPLEGARVTLEGTIGSGASAVPLESSTLTDAEGRFTLAGVPEGVRSIAIWAADHHGRIRSGLTIVRGETLDVGAIDLAPVEEGERPGLELAGIGAVLSAEGDAMVIGRVVEGGGAAEIGLVAGDAILEIDGASVVSLGFAGTIERIRGPEGTTVRVRVRRASGEVVELSVPRRRIRA